MKMLLMLVVMIVAGCATVPAPRTPDGNYDNESRWQQQNRKIQEACVLRIIEIAPPTATAEELDYNLKLCLLRNGAFI